MNSKKIIVILSIIAFVLCLILPGIYFNFEKEATSEIDNRMLAENPFTQEVEVSELPSVIENYVNDRIGFRNAIISAYTVLNDKIWAEMVHPTYVYGQDGEVFFDFRQTEYTEYHERYLDMIREIQEYCYERDIPFLFVLEPGKVNALADKAPEGINYNFLWRDRFVQGLNERNINYVDNYDILKGGYVEGQRVFNVKFDAGHWNSLGAFYGVNNILNNMSESYPQIHVNKLSEFEKTTNTETSLLVSEFPINEDVDYYAVDESGIDDLTEKYTDEVYRDPSYQGFGYYVNERERNVSPKTLVFQGSYMNGKGAGYLKNALSEYIFVHDYQNVMNLEYYFNIFQPEYVIFEVADYTISDGYFSEEAMNAIDYNPSLFDSLENAEPEIEDLRVKCLVEPGDTLVKITVVTELIPDSYIWISDGAKEFSILQDGTVTLEKDMYQDICSDMMIYVLLGEKMYVYPIQWE